MAYNDDAQVFERQIVIENISQQAGVTSGSIVNKGTLSTLDTYITGHTVVNNVKITPNLNDIIHEQQATLANNQASFTNITDFFFDDSAATSFKAIINVTVSAGQAKYAVWEINGLYKPSGWVITSSFTGDLTGVDFSIANEAGGIGQMQYKNSNTSGTTTIRYRATTTAPPGSTPIGVSGGVINNTSGPFLANNLIYANTAKTLASTDITYNSNLFTIGGASRLVAEKSTSFVNFSNGGAITSMGDASVAKRIIVGEKVGIATTAPSYALDVVGDINFTGSFYKNNNIYSGSEIWATNGTSVFYTQGNVGFGTSTPSHQLDVSGSARVTSGFQADTILASTSISSGLLIATNATASNIVATAFSSGSVNVTDIVATAFSSGSVNVTNIVATAFSSGSVNATNVTSSNIVATAFSSGSVNATNATVSNIAIGTLNVNNITSGHIIPKADLTYDLGSSSVRWRDIYLSTSTIKFADGTELSTSSGNLKVTDNNTGKYVSLGGESISSGTLVATNVTLSNINTSTISSGSVNVTNVIASNILTTAFSSGSVNVTNISTSTLQAPSGITVGNINFTGSLYQNGIPYLGSQWTSTAGNVSYTSGSVSATNINSTIITTGTLLANTITGGNLSLSGDLIIGGTLTTVNITTTNVVDTNISTGTLNVGSTLNVGTSISSGMLAATNATTTNIVTTAFTSGSINVSGLSVLANTTATNVSAGVLIASTGLTTGSISASGLSVLANTTATNVSAGVLIASTGLTAGSVFATTIVGSTSISSGMLAATNVTATNIVATALTAGALKTSDIALNGNLVATGDITAFGSLSDRRLKTNIIDIDMESALNTVRSLRPVTFDWRDDIFNESKRGTHDVGFIAQEVEEVVPQAVAEYKEMNSGALYKNIKHERLIPYLVGAIQKLQLRIEELEKKL